jgi:hypothetical protein
MTEPAAGKTTSADGRKSTHRAFCVFCGSSFGASPSYRAAAEQMGKELVSRSADLVYGGSGSGLMGAAAREVMKGGGRVIGIIPEFLRRQSLSLRVTELHVVQSMHERKALMEEMSDGFIALPGGIGTLEELMEMFAWSQLGIHAKPVGVLNTENFYDAFMKLMEHMVHEGFLKEAHAGNLIIENEAEKLMDRMLSYRHNYEPKLPE